MKKTITIDDKEFVCEANAFTPILYRQIFRKDFLTEIQKLTALKGKNKETLTNDDIDLYSDKSQAFSRLAFIMSEQGSGKAVPELVKLNDIDFFTWMTQFEANAFENVTTLSEIIALWKGNSEDKHIEAKN